MFKLSSSLLLTILATNFNLISMHNMPSKYTPSPLRYEDHSLPLIEATTWVDPKLLSKVLFEKTFENDSLNEALTIIKNAPYNYTKGIELRPLECFRKGLFESRKKACICLLENALERYKKE